MKNYTLKEKAYEIDFSRIEEGYLFSEYITYAENRNQAKTQLLKDSYCQSICLQGSDDEVTYLTIPVIRAKQADKYDFEGSSMTKQQISEELEERERKRHLDNILNDESITHCYIRKGNYYRPNSCGYTDFKHRAGIYSKKEAVSHAMSCRDIDLEIINIDNHNKMIQEEIQELQTRLIEL